MDAGSGRKQPTPSGIVSASPAAVVALHSITVQQCYHIDKLLPHLRLAPALRSLTLNCVRNTIPSPAVLVDLLTAAPALSIRICRFGADPTLLDAYDSLANSVDKRAFATRFAVE